MCQTRKTHCCNDNKVQSLSGSLPKFSKVSVYKYAHAHQTVKASSQKVHRTHLHGGDLGHIDWRTQVQVQQITQQVTLTGNDMWLVHGCCWPTAHWALTCVDAVIRQNSRLVNEMYLETQILRAPKVSQITGKL